MKVSTKSKIILALLSISIALSIFSINTSYFYDNHRKEFLEETNNLLKLADFWNLTGTPIEVDDTDPMKNWSYTASTYNWCSGSGTWNDPYVIENVTIDGQNSGSCIFIANSEVSFIIRNCTLYNSGAVFRDSGIRFENVNNSHMIKNNCSFNNFFGLLLENSHNNTLLENTANNNKYPGVYLFFSNMNHLEKNIASGSLLSNGIQLRGANNTIIINNTFNQNSINGIGLYTDCNNNTISSNYMIGNGQSGISITDSLYNNVFNNTAINNQQYGIQCELLNTYGCDFSNFSENILLENDYGGIIFFGDCDNNTISKNRIQEGSIGIGLSNSLYNNISENYIENIEYYGIKTWGSRYNTFSNNKILYCDDTGIYLEQDSNENTIIDNEVKYNHKNGIILENSHNNSLLLNDVNFNYRGIYLDNCIDNNILLNTINFNGHEGVYLSQSNFTLVSNNILIGNEICIYESDSENNTFLNNECNNFTTEINVEIKNQFFSTEEFNITLHIYNDFGQAIDSAAIQIWWDGTDVSSNIQNLGGGQYFVYFTPITVSPGDNPILLNMSISAEGFQDKYFETFIAVDPELMDKTEPEPEPEPEIPGIPGYYSYLILFSIIIGTIHIIKKRKKKYLLL